MAGPPDHRGVGKRVQYTLERGAHATGLIDAESFYRVRGDRAPIVASRYGKPQSGSSGALLTRRFQLVQLCIPFFEERITVHDEALVQLVGACLDDPLVLMVDAERDISGAACRLPELDAVLISRREFAGRRHFDLAHELFHILTWDAMPPEHSETARETGGNRVEQLANTFAAGAG